MRLIDRYMLWTTLRPLAASLVVVLGVLLLERILRLFSLLVDRRGPLALVLEMAANLVPHYLGLALPAAFFLSVLFVTARLSADNELDAFRNSGLSLARIAAPFFAIAAVLVALGAVLYGFTQPYSRYSYRAVLHVVTHGVWDATLQQGIFVTREDGFTIAADSVDSSGRRLTGVFIHQEKDGETIVTTAAQGRIGISPDGTRLLMTLRDGIQLRNRERHDAMFQPENESDSGPVVLSFGEMTLDRTFRFDALPFRVRGGSEREMTLLELVQERQSPTGEVPMSRVDSEFHARLARIVSPLLLPLLAVPLGLASRRSHRNHGIALAALLLVLFHHSVQVGESLGDIGAVSPPLGVWTPFAVFGLFGLWVFRRSSELVGDNPLLRAVEGLETLVHRGVGLLRGRRRAEIGGT